MVPNKQNADAGTWQNLRMEKVMHIEIPETGRDAKALQINTFEDSGSGRSGTVQVRIIKRNVKHEVESEERVTVYYRDFVAAAKAVVMS